MDQRAMSNSTFLKYTHNHPIDANEKFITELIHARLNPTVIIMKFETFISKPMNGK